MKAQCTEIMPSSTCYLVGCCVTAATNIYSFWLKRSEGNWFLVVWFFFAVRSFTYAVFRKLDGLFGHKRFIFAEASKVEKVEALGVELIFLRVLEFTKVTSAAEQTCDNSKRDIYRLRERNCSMRARKL